MLDINLLRRDLAGVIARLERAQEPAALPGRGRASRRWKPSASTIQIAHRSSCRRGATRCPSRSASSRARARTPAAADGRGGRHRRRAEGRRRAAGGDPGRAAADADGRCPTCRRTACRVGADETGNVEVRRWGTPRAASTSTPRTTSTWAPRWAWTSRPAPGCRGSRFTFLRGPVARLHRALAQFMLDVQTQEHGYTECYTPYIVNREMLRRHRPAAQVQGRHVLA